MTVTPVSARIGEIAELVKQLRDHARRKAEASQLIADAKTRRNREAGDNHSDYRGVAAVDTMPWRAADGIEHLLSLVAQHREALAMVDDSIRQGLQVIRSEADNVRARLRTLNDADVTASQAAIDRAIVRIDGDLRRAAAILGPSAVAGEGENE